MSCSAAVIESDGKRPTSAPVVVIASADAVSGRFMGSDGGRRPTRFPARCDELRNRGGKRRRTADDEAGAVSVDTSFVFYAELRRIALKSFAAAEPIRKMLRTKFKTSVLRAFILGEDDDCNVELLVVHGELVPDQSDMATACRRLSASMGRQLTVHVISHSRYTSLTPRDALGAKLAASSAFEIIGDGDTKAKAPTQGEGLLQSARRKLAALAG